MKGWIAWSEGEGIWWNIYIRHAGRPSDLAVGIGMGRHEPSLSKISGLLVWTKSPRVHSTSIQASLHSMTVSGYVTRSSCDLRIEWLIWLSQPFDIICISFQWIQLGCDGRQWINHRCSQSVALREYSMYSQNFGLRFWSGHLCMMNWRKSHHSHALPICFLSIARPSCQGSQGRISLAIH